MSYQSAFGKQCCLLQLESNFNLKRFPNSFSEKRGKYQHYFIKLLGIKKCVLKNVNEF